MPLPLATAPPFPYAGEAAAALSALLWASAQIAFARIRPPISAGALNLGKNVAASLCFAVLLAALTGSPWPIDMPSEAVVWFALSGLAGLTICDTLLIRSLLAIGPRRMSLVMTIHPVIVAIAVIFPPFEEHPATLTWIGMLVCLTGIALAILERPPRALPDGHFRRGIRDAVLAAVFQAAAVLLARHGGGVARANGADGATVRMVFGALGVVLIGLPAGRIVGWGRELAHGPVVRILFVAAFFGTFLGIWLNQLGLEWTELTGVATVLNSMMPIYLIPLSAIFLSEKHTLQGWLAALVAMAGIALMTL